MKLVRYGLPGSEKPGIIDANGDLRDLSAIIADIEGSVLSQESIRVVGQVDLNSLPVVRSARLGPCVGHVGKIICIGLNYSDHAAESNMTVPQEPVVFMKATSSICGPDDDIVLPKGSVKTDWEVELGVVIGAEARYVSYEDALSYVCGYCVINDISERALQLEGTGQWVKGKSADTFGPIGPWLVTKDEIPDPQNLELWLEVDGQRMETRRTGFARSANCERTTPESRACHLQRRGPEAALNQRSTSRPKWPPCSRSPCGLLVLLIRSRFGLTEPRASAYAA